jgi:hypothetical protein
MKKRPRAHVYTTYNYFSFEDSSGHTYPSHTPTPATMSECKIEQMELKATEESEQYARDQAKALHDQRIRQEAKNFPLMFVCIRPVPGVLDLNIAEGETQFICLERGDCIREVFVRCEFPTHVSVLDSHLPLKDRYIHNLTRKGLLQVTNYGIDTRIVIRYTPRY